ncbi:hypothetical protein OsI_19976 [Oryza sativa Indica Group]|uniref:Uncharacterized protein n=1 Tax=Oryza sativa subsp. indica TaxID=39946 RepID=B8AYA6_ORYSI|nr:hypothetical protein OsI_19976 [Oryza sativa Indica Group]
MASPTCRSCSIILLLRLQEPAAPELPHALLEVAASVAHAVDKLGLAAASSLWSSTSRGRACRRRPPPTQRLQEPAAPEPPHAVLEVAASVACAGRLRCLRRGRTHGRGRLRVWAGKMGWKRRKKGSRG